MGLTVDHLYPQCPLLKRTVTNPIGDKPPGHPCIDLVDPLGECICGWCQHVWRLRHGRDVA